MDTETTGLNPKVHEVIEIGLIVVDSEDLSESDRFYSKVAPERMEDADERALLINHYSWQSWIDAPAKEVVVDRLEPFFDEHTIICGHNIPFDIAFIDAMFKSCNKGPLLYGGIIDTKRVAKQLNIKSASYRLGALCQKLGIDQKNAHSALSDVMANIELFRQLKRIRNFQFKDVIIANSGKHQLKISKKDSKLF